MKQLGLILLFLGLNGLAMAQSFEAAVSGGVSQFNNGTLGSLDNFGSRAALDNGFRLTARLTFNTYKRAGWETGYAYSRTKLDLGDGAPQGMGIHTGFGNFLVYATPDEARVRPFVTGGVNFSNFVPPGQSAQYGQGENKFGFNYGAGLKVKISGPWQLRLDARQFNTGKPFGLAGASGRLLQNEFSVGLGYTM